MFAEFSEENNLTIGSLEAEGQVMFVSVDIYLSICLISKCIEDFLQCDHVFASLVRCFPNDAIGAFSETLLNLVMPQNVGIHAYGFWFNKEPSLEWERKTPYPQTSSMINGNSWLSFSSSNFERYSCEFIFIARKEDRLSLHRWYLFGDWLHGDSLERVDVTMVNTQRSLEDEDTVPMLILFLFQCGPTWAECEWERLSSE